MEHEQVRVKKGSHASQRSHFGPAPITLNTTTPQSPLMQHHRNIGNQAVQRLMEFGTIQAKLSIGRSNDKYEQEADRVADQVMRMAEPGIQLQSTCPECIEEEEGIQTKSLADQITPLVQRQIGFEEEEKELLQGKGVTGQTSEVTPCVESRIQSLKRDGQSLPKSVRNYFEPRFGVDFSDVRVHTDTRASQTAQELNARAFTTGRDVVFGTGQYSPETSNGKKLLAHELTHVIQQDGEMISSSAVPAKQSTSDFSIQRTTVTVEDDCAGTQKEIENAVADARAGIGRIADPEATECLTSELDGAEIVCQAGETCGSANYFGSTIYVYNWDDGCPSLPALILHETAHKCKFWNTEKFAEACENEAFGGSGATPPGPDEEGGVCEL